MEFPSDLDTAGKGPGHGLKNASKKGLQMAVLIGERERASGSVVLKNLAARTEETVPRAGLGEKLAGNLRHNARRE